MNFKIDRSKNIEPLYIHEVQNHFESLSPEQSTTIILYLDVDGNGTYKCLAFKIPGQKFERMDYFPVIGKYILARINNLLVTFGGCRLAIYYDKSDEKISQIINNILQQFDLDNPRNHRTGLGSILNYINRINCVLGTHDFQVDLQDISSFCKSDPTAAFRLPSVNELQDGGFLLQQAATELEGKTYCGLDIGGNSIKAAVITNGKITLLKTYNWFPAQFTTTEELLNPILLLVRFLNAVTASNFENNDSEQHDALQSMLADTASYNELLVYTICLEDKISADLLRADPGSFQVAPIFDGIVAGFPDIIVNNKIVGGETYKQRGIRQHHQQNYESEFGKMRNLDDYIRAFVKPDGIVRVLNDGSLSSIVFSVDQAFSGENCIGENGLLAFTIGTEMGAGYISRTGSILNLPLECYNYIIDLNSLAFSCYCENDVRSINNFNTCVPGTVQKYISQIGFIRLACWFMAEMDIAGFDKLKAMGYLQYDTEKDQLTIVTYPCDMRSQLTRLLMEYLEDGNEAVRKAYLEIGKCIGNVIDEVRFMIPELSPDKFVSGGLVNEDVCFATMREGLTTYNPSYKIWRLDNSMIQSPLLKNLEKNQVNYMTAIGASYLANLEWIKFHQPKKDLLTHEDRY